MKKSIRIVAFCLVFVLTACVQANKSVLGFGSWRLPNLLSTVASDALVVEYAESLKSCSLCKEVSSQFSEINFGKLADNEAVVSWCNSGTIVPILSLSAAKADSTDIASIQIQAKSKKLYCEYIKAEKPFFLISSSEARINAAIRHIKEGVSILNNDDFTRAASLSSNHSTFVVARSSALKTATNGLLTQNFLNDKLTQNFISDFAQWYVLYESANKHQIRTVQPIDDKYFFHNIMEKLPYCDSHLGEILPKDTKFAVSLPLALPEYRYEYEDFLEAHSKKQLYQNGLSNYKKANKVEPKQWELEQKFQEIALVYFGDNQEVVLMRSAKRVNFDTSENPYKGILTLLYGAAFSLKDDSYRRGVGNWTIIGSQDAVNQCADAFLQQESEDEMDLKNFWPKKNIHAVLFNSGNIICWNKNGIEIWTL